MKKINILHAVSSLNVGGAERFVIDLACTQKNEGNRVTILSFGKHDDALVAVCKTLNINVITLDSRRVANYIELLHLLREYDIYHIHSPYVLSYCLPILLFIRKIKLIYTRHGANPLNSSKWWLTHRLLRSRFDVITFVSEEGKQVFKANHVMPAVPQVVIDNGVNMPQVEVNKSFTERVKIVSVGRMVQLKYQKDLILSCAQLPSDVKNTISIEFYGDGPMMSELKTLAQKYLELNIIFNGMVSNRDEIFNDADILVVNSESEGLSMAIIEAMSYKTAVIATAVGGTPKLIENDKTGFLYNFGDIEQLTDKLLMLILNVDKRHALGEQAFHHIKNHFSIESTTQKYALIYRES